MIASSMRCLMVSALAASAAADASVRFTTGSGTHDVTSDTVDVVVTQQDGTVTTQSGVSTGSLGAAATINVANEGALDNVVFTINGNDFWQLDSVEYKASASGSWETLLAAQQSCPSSAELSTDGSEGLTSVQYVPGCSASNSLSLTTVTASSSTHPNAKSDGTSHTVSLVTADGLLLPEVGTLTGGTYDEVGATTIANLPAVDVAKVVVEAGSSDGWMVSSLSVNGKQWGLEGSCDLSAHWLDTDSGAERKERTYVNCDTPSPTPVPPPSTCAAVKTTAPSAVEWPELALSKTTGSSRFNFDHLNHFLTGASMYVPEIQQGDDLQLTCCDGECQFLVAIYRCLPCSPMLNGGFDSELAASWDSVPCGPTFEVTGRTDGPKPMVVHHTTLQQGESHTVSLGVATADVPYIAVFKKDTPAPVECYLNKGPVLQTPRDCNVCNNLS